jgi:hypothetical protein
VDAFKSDGEGTNESSAVAVASATALASMSPPFSASAGASRDDVMVELHNNAMANREK